MNSNIVFTGTDHINDIDIELRDIQKRRDSNNYKTGLYIEILVTKHVEVVVKSGNDTLVFHIIEL